MQSTTQCIPTTMDKKRTVLSNIEPAMPLNTVKGGILTLKCVLNDDASHINDNVQETDGAK